MEGPIFNFSIEDITKIVRTVLDVFKKVMAWLGILILPDEGEYDYPNNTTVSAGDLAQEGA